MQKPGEEIHLSGAEASSGEKQHIVRYVLGISLMLVILLFIALLLFWK